jgi:hypothetical protein
MALFDKMTQPVVLKEDSDLNEQLKQLTEFLQKPLSADVFVIECKNFYGNIEIDSDGNFTRTMQYGKRFQKTGIYSPITQNKRHLDLIRHIRQKDKNFLTKMVFKFSFDDFYRSVIVLTNPQTVLNAKKAPKEIRDRVIRADQLIEYIKREESKSKELSSSEAGMWRFAQKFLNMHRKRNMDYTQKYFDKATDTPTTTDVPVQKQLSSEDTPICSECGAPMVKRTAAKGSYTGKDFFGCSKYPACRNILNIP